MLEKFRANVLKASVDGANMAVRLALNLRDELIEQYLKIGYNHAEILSCLRSPQRAMTSYNYLTSYLTSY